MCSVNSQKRGCSSVTRYRNLCIWSHKLFYLVHQLIRTRIEIFLVIERIVQTALNVPQIKVLVRVGPVLLRFSLV